MQAYCVKCKTKKEMKNAKAITMKNKKPATQGTCPTCGTKMFRIGKAQVFPGNASTNEEAGWSALRGTPGLFNAYGTL